MKENHKNKEDEGTPSAKRNVRSSHASQMDQQQTNTTGLNKYSDWSFDELYTECKRRNLL